MDAGVMSWVWWVVVSKERAVDLCVLICVWHVWGWGCVGCGQAFVCGLGLCVGHWGCGCVDCGQALAVVDVGWADDCVAKRGFRMGRVTGANTKASAQSDCMVGLANQLLMLGGQWRQGQLRAAQVPLK